MDNYELKERTEQILNCVRDHNYDDLTQICDDDYGIVDIDPEGGSRIIRSREEWEGWFKGLFNQLSQMKAKTWSEITKYDEVITDAMAYSVVEFNQMLQFDGNTHRFPVISTIIWKKNESGEWLESRYHCSMTGESQLVSSK